MTTETRKRRTYTEDFKRDAVALVIEQGYKPSEVARSLGIGDNLIRIPGTVYLYIHVLRSSARPLLPILGQNTDCLLKPCIKYTVP